MPDLRHQLHAFRHQPTLWVGVGNDSYGDDAAGLDLAQRLAESGIPHVVNAGTNPERWIATVQLGSFANVVLLDAVELGAQPGSVVLLTADEIAARFPQVSTHKISLGLLARYVQSQSAARAWLLGLQPQSIWQGRNPGIGCQPPALDIRRSTFDVGSSTLDVERSALSNWLSIPDVPAPLRPAQHHASPTSPSPQPHIQLTSSQAGERAGVRGNSPRLLSAPVQLTIQLLHQLITESDNESAEPATFDRKAALSALPQ